MDREHRCELVKHMLFPEKVIFDSPEELVQHKIESLISTIDRTVQGGVWSHEKFDGARRHRVGILMDKRTADSIGGVETVLKRLSVTGLCFVLRDEIQIENDTVHQMNAEFWVA